jgi:hypothetical protein
VVLAATNVAALRFCELEHLQAHAGRLITPRRPSPRVAPARAPAAGIPPPPRRSSPQAPTNTICGRPLSSSQPQPGGPTIPPRLKPVLTTPNTVRPGPAALRRAPACRARA